MEKKYEWCFNTERERRSHRTTAQTFLNIVGNSAISPVDMDLSVSVYVCVCLLRSITGITILAKIGNVTNDVCSCWYSPSKYVTAKIVLRDFDLLFESKIFDTLISLKWFELA